MSVTVNVLLAPDTGVRLSIDFNMLLKDGYSTPLHKLLGGGVSTP